MSAGVRPTAPSGSADQPHPKDGSRSSPAAQRALPVRFLIPFVTTSARHDVMLVVGGLPLWWALGVDQFVYPLLLTVPTLKVLVTRRIVVSPVLVALAAFLAVYLASAAFIVEDERYLTFAKNLSTYVSALMLVIVVPAAVRSWTEARTLLVILALSMGAAGVIGILAVSGILRVTFTSPFGALLPAPIADTALGRNIVERSWGWTSWFAGLGSYFRVKSVFLWPTSYAPALTLVLPAVVFLAATSRRRVTRALFYGTGLLLAVNLVFTTGRAAAVALVAGAGYWYLVARPVTTWWWRALALATMGCAAVLIVAIEPGALDVADRVHELVFARGAGSPTSRWTIYAQTLAGVAERPLLGWGTERTIPGVADTFIYPAGSHSYLLGTLYRQGALGMIAFLVLWWVTWRATAPVVNRGCRRVVGGGSAAAFLAVGRGIVVSALLMSLTVAFDVDASLMLVWWTLVALFVAVRRLSGALGVAPPEAMRR